MQAQQQAMNSSTSDAQPMDIGATHKGKGKYNNKGKGKHNEGKGKTNWHNKGKGYTGYSQQGYKGKGPTPIGHGNPFKGAMQYKGKSKGKGPPPWQSTTMNKGNGKGTVTNVANMGRMPGYTQKYIWLDSVPWGSSPLWFTCAIRSSTSSAESEFYAIGTGATEALHLKNFLGEILHNKISLKMHTDTTLGKSMATRSGVSKRAKHIELKYMFTVHTTPHSRRHSFHTQNQHQTQPSRYTYKIPARRSAAMALACCGHTSARQLRRIQLQQFQTPVVYEHNKCTRICSIFD